MSFEVVCKFIQIHLGGLGAISQLRTAVLIAARCCGLALRSHTGEVGLSRWLTPLPGPWDLGRSLKASGQPTTGDVPKKVGFSRGISMYPEGLDAGHQ